MVIVRRREYLDGMKAILSFIARDSVNRAMFFKHQLDGKIDNLVYFPYKYRQSVHHSSKNVRDLIYKGYTIVYRVNIQEDKIEILEIFKWTK